ncbi:oligopeptide/dipeptide ABC transporter ATP-binding protein [Qiania dongpingensis]|uniref:Oligopeptide/dipeptide ABC transporter C-terminal domain-containing protein n=1 Tax=Qiania dongpingensis TaxID=2763669 RepID=A0A7G9G2L7_9FIRM|nr:oligopeptide/dipeptide ABC transporter ATP-binding protein [Qiania dongpingensis]QNM05049.1 hypothetical protein H9Q78_11420 [Qiania dongpingensis]
MAAEVMEKPAHPYTELLVRCAEAFTLGREENNRKKSLPDRPELESCIGKRENGCDFYPYCKRPGEKCRSIRPELPGKVDEHCAACHFPEN